MGLEQRLRTRIVNSSLSLLPRTETKEQMSKIIEISMNGDKTVPQNTDSELRLKSSKSIR